MRIGGIGNIYPTYVYNPNTVSANSMNKLSRISDNVLDKRVDYSETEAQENQNPLKKGQTIDFEGIVAKQMQQGQSRAAKIMPGGLAPVEDKDKAEEIKKQETVFKTADNNEKENTVDTAVKMNVASESENSAAENDYNNVTQMQRAIQAYEMFMTA